MIEILFEDEFCVIVNKPSGLLTHPSKETKEKENLLHFVRDQINHPLLPIHRLDRQTSGCLIFGKQSSFVRKMKEIWHTDQVTKKYKALILAQNLEADKYDFALKSEKGIYQEACTIFKPLEHINLTTLIEATIHTGRRHQIRRHFSRRMQHIAGDRRYGKKKYNDYFKEHYGLDRLFLHSHLFEFYHPESFEKISIKSELPIELYNVLNLMRSELS